MPIKYDDNGSRRQVTLPIKHEFIWGEMHHHRNLAYHMGSLRDMSVQHD